MFTIYRGEEVIFIPESRINALRYNKTHGTVDVSYDGGHERFRDVDAVNYASESMPFTLKYKK